MSPPQQPAEPYLTEGGRGRRAGRRRWGRRDRHPGPAPGGSGCSALGTSAVTHSCGEGGGVRDRGESGRGESRPRGWRGSTLGLFSSSWLQRAAGFSQQPGAVGPRTISPPQITRDPPPSAAPAAETQDIFHAAVSPRRANPTELTLRHQSRSRMWQRDRSLSATRTARHVSPAGPSGHQRRETCQTDPQAERRRRGAVLSCSSHQGETSLSPDSPNRSDPTSLTSQGGCLYPTLLPSSKEPPKLSKQVAKQAFPTPLWLQLNPSHHKPKTNPSCTHGSPRTAPGPRSASPVGLYGTR